MKKIFLIGLILLFLLAGGIAGAVLTGLIEPPKNVAPSNNLTFSKEVFEKLPEIRNVKTTTVCTSSVCNAVTQVNFLEVGKQPAFIKTSVPLRKIILDKKKKTEKVLTSKEISDIIDAKIIEGITKLIDEKVISKSVIERTDKVTNIKKGN